MGFVLGVQGVHATVGGLHGHRDETSIGYDVFEGREVQRTAMQDGTLAVFELDDFPITPILGLVEDEPFLVDRFGPIIRSVKEASVGLGGLRYTVGLRVSF